MEMDRGVVISSQNYEREKQLKQDRVLGDQRQDLVCLSDIRENCSGSKNVLNFTYLQARQCQVNL